MFLGHVGVGLGAKALVPRVSLGTLLFASFFIDLLWATLLVLGLERVEISPGATAVTPLLFTEYPFSHSLVAVIFWAALFGLVFFLVRRCLKDALVCGAVVLSHWTLDLVAHRQDLQLIPGLPARVGFGLWNNITATLAVEISIFAFGIILYCYHTKASDRTGSMGFRSMLILLPVLYLFQIFGPPPPEATVLELAGQALWLLVIWGYWIERHRTLRWLYN